MRPLVLAILALMMIWPAAVRADSPIHPMGEGVIRVCWDWGIMASRKCHKYHHVRLPPAIAVGDTFHVEYGSNPKGYQFRVGRIAIDSGVCWIYSGQDGHSRDRIKVGCEEAAQ